MAGRAQPVSAKPGFGVAIALVALILGAMLAVALRAEAGRGFSSADWAAIRFTLVQAILSAIMSVAFAIPVARALARRRFVGRQLLITLLGAPFILPVIVAVLGLLEVFGRNGWLSSVLALFGLDPLNIYGLHGVVLAHVFFNLPLATRLILQGWGDIPSERFRLAAQLGFGPAETWRMLERPMLMRTVPGALMIVFAICLTSFAVALTLGGGPRATTVELAIYQAFRFDFDLSRAALLSCVQIGLAGTAALIALRLTRIEGFGAGLDRAVQRWDAERVGLIWQDRFLILGASLFLLLPLAAIVLSGLQGMTQLPVGVIKAAITSLIVALGSTVLLLFMAVPLALSMAQHKGGVLELTGLLGMVVSPLVIGTGLFVVINPVADPFALALPVTALVNAIMALPFALRALVPGARDVLHGYGRLGLSLNMQGGPFLRLVVLRRLAPQIGFAAGLTAALSMGDLGVIALFADPERATLPLQMYRLMGAYQMQAAQSAALILMVLSLLLFWLFDRGGRRYAEP